MDLDFVQIGANVGDTNNDPVYPKVKDGTLKSGLLVEANPKCIAPLKKNYENYPGMMFDNIAIGNFMGKVTLYVDNWFIDNNGKGEGTSQNATTVAAVYGNVEGMPSVEVDCITLEALWVKHQLGHVKKLFIDAEGQDYNILMSTDFSKVDVDEIQFEHIHLNGQASCPIKFKEIMNHLSEYGYSLKGQNAEDTIVTKVWMR